MLHSSVGVIVESDLTITLPKLDITITKTLTIEASTITFTHEKGFHLVNVRYEGATYTYIALLAREWPEVINIAVKLISGKPLSDVEEQGLRELAESTGWSTSDIIDELKNINVSPSERVEVYRELFEKYYREALELKERDTVQASEKLWGAITALIKLHATLTNTPIIVWAHGKLYNYVVSNVPREYRRLFIDMLEAGEPLHRHFYERTLSQEAFIECWGKAVELIEMIKEIVYREAQRRGLTFKT